MPDLAKWAEEKQSAYLYRVLSAAEAGTPREALFVKLADEADRQAVLWIDGGAAPPAYRPSPRVKLVAGLVRLLGPRPIKGVLAAMKVRGMSVYSHQTPDIAAPAPGAAPGSPPGHPMPASLHDVGLRHKGVAAGGNLRAAVFGVNDGLVSNASLILGVAGATGDPQVLLLSGAAGLLAGAFSMAAGEYISVRSQREMFEYQIGEERDELGKYPEAEAAELALIFEARGIPGEEARALAAKLIADPARALDTLAREELGLDPTQLGSPWSAALFSFGSFALGAAVPLAPFVFTRGANALYIAGALTGATLFCVGAAISLFTGRGALRGGLRMLLIGGSAGAATYAIGRVLGVNLS